MWLPGARAWLEATRNLCSGWFEKSVGKDSVAILQQQGPAAVAASDCRQHAIRAALWDGHLRGNRPGFIFECGGRTFRDTDHSRKVHKLAAASGETRSNCRIGS